MEADPYIFVETAAQHDRGGATLDIIREGVDYRRKVSLTDAELDGGLKRLKSANLIRLRRARYFVADSIVPSLPRTASGQLSFRRQEWDRLRMHLFES